MAYKPNRQETSFDASPDGVARVKLLKGKQLGVKYLEDNDNEFAGKKYRVSEWPDFVDPKGLPGYDWKIRLDSKGSKLFSIAPVEGVFQVKVKKFVAKDGEEPAPKYMVNWKYPENIFYVLLEVVNDCPAKGMEIFYMLPYRFAEDDDGNAMYTKWNERSNTVKLDEFLSYTCAWDKGPIKFSDNLLPKIQKRILKAGKTFGVYVKNGYVDYLMAGDMSPVYDEEDNEEWETPVEEPITESESEEETPFDWDD